MTSIRDELPPRPRYRRIALARAAAVHERSVKPAPRRWGVVCPAALAGLLIGAAAGLVAAPDVIALPGVLASAGLALGLLVGLLVAWRLPSERDGARARAIDRRVRRGLASWALDHVIVDTAGTGELPGIAVRVR